VRERSGGPKKKRIGRKRKGKKGIRWDTGHEVSGCEKIRISSLANQMMQRGRGKLSFI
jgi:hypothetical protein